MIDIFRVHADYRPSLNCSFVVEFDLKPTLNTRFVKNDICVFAIFALFVSSNAVPTGPTKTASSRSTFASGPIKASNTHWSNINSFNATTLRSPAPYSSLTHWSNINGRKQTNSDRRRNKRRVDALSIPTASTDQPELRFRVLGSRSKSCAPLREAPTANRRIRVAPTMTGCSGYGSDGLDRRCTQPDAWLSASTSSRAADPGSPHLEHQRAAGTALTGSASRSGVPSLGSACRCRRPRGGRGQPRCSCRQARCSTRPRSRRPRSRRCRVS